MRYERQISDFAFGVREVWCRSRDLGQCVSDMAGEGFVLLATHSGVADTVFEPGHLFAVFQRVGDIPISQSPVPAPLGRPTVGE